MNFLRLMHTRARVPEYNFFTGATILSLVLRMKSVQGANALQVVRLIDHLCSEPEKGARLLDFNQQQKRYEVKPGFVLHTEARLLPCIEAIAEQHTNIITHSQRLQQPQLPGQPFIVDENFANRDFIIASVEPYRMQRRIAQQEREIAVLMLEIGAPVALPSQDTPKDILELYDYNLIRLIDSNYDATVRWLNFKPSSDYVPRFKPN